jgi:hypothetical protein
MYARILLLLIAVLSADLNAEELDVMYRRDVIDTNTAPIEEYPMHRIRSAIRRIFYDKNAEYLLLELQSGRFYTSIYHYCGVPESTVLQLAAHSRPTLFYWYEIRNGHDCRNGFIPAY